MNEVDATAVLGFLLYTACELEKTLDFHHSICLKNIFVAEGSLALLNPYIKQSHCNSLLAMMQETSYQSDWRAEYSHDYRQRLLASSRSKTVAKVVEVHRQHTSDMLTSIGVVVCQLCTGRDDSFFFFEDGSIDQNRLSQAV